MNVLSLFDGISCCRLALERIGFEIENYYSSEIDKYAMQVANSNYKDTVQIGDITKWKGWDIDWSKIDLVTGGFPCKSWSVAGQQLGDKSESGKLFWTMLEVMRRVKEYNPNAIFLIENVKMKKDFEKYITYHTESALGKVNKYLINSALVSAQNRNRYYWTNIDGIEQPKDKEITFDGLVAWSRSTRYPKNREKYVEMRTRENGKANTLTTGSGCGSFSSKNFVFAHCDNKKVVESKNGKTLCLTSSYGKGLNASRSRSGIAPIEAIGMDYKKAVEMGFRMLSPEECEFLQTIPIGYTSVVSKTQRFKTLGNAWTVDVVAHIFKGMK